jgi:plastocyanin/uncharacterized membrane protein YozB (DUF420 family)
MPTFSQVPLFSTITLIVEILILAGLYVGFYYARRRKFRPHHANIQASMVLLNLFLIVVIMVPGFNRFVIQGGTTTGTVGTLMIVHALLGAVTEGVALYLVFSERFRVIPRNWRFKKLKRVMRIVLGMWTIVVILGIGIYYLRYLAPRASATPSAIPAAAALQFQAETLLIHADELTSASDRGSAGAVRRHTEHLVNLIVGKSSADYGDMDRDGQVEDPGDGTGMLSIVRRVRDEAASANQSEAVQAAEDVRLNLLRIVDDSKILLGANNYDLSRPQIDNIERLARQIAQGGSNSVPQIVRLLNTAVERPLVNPAQPAGGTVTVDMKDFAFVPRELNVKKGTTVVFLNSDPAKHTATDDKSAWNSRDIDAGQSFTFTFQDSGAFPYHCEYHGDVGGVDMAGVITVTE